MEKMLMTEAQKPIIYSFPPEWYQWFYLVLKCRLLSADVSEILFSLKTVPLMKQSAEMWCSVIS
jgi:hypothetical protein